MIKHEVVHAAIELQRYSMQGMIHVKFKGKKTSKIYNENIQI